MENENPMDHILIERIGDPEYIGPQLRPPIEGRWVYRFLVRFGDWEWHAPILVPDTIPDDKLEDEAVDRFKRSVALIAKKVSEY